MLAQRVTPELALVDADQLRDNLDDAEVGQGGGDESAADAKDDEGLSSEDWVLRRPRRWRHNDERLGRVGVSGAASLCRDGASPG
jgi:hypothetical protein